MVGHVITSSNIWGPHRCPRSWNRIACTQQKRGNNLSLANCADARTSEQIHLRLCGSRLFRNALPCDCSILLDQRARANSIQEGLQVYKPKSTVHHRGDKGDMEEKPSSNGKCNNVWNRILNHGTWMEGVRIRPGNSFPCIFIPGSDKHLQGKRQPTIHLCISSDDVYLYDNPCTFLRLAWYEPPLRS